MEEERVQKHIENRDLMVTYGDGVGDTNMKEPLEFHKEHGKYATVIAVQPPGRFGAIDLDERDNTIDAPAVECRAGSSLSSRFCSLVVDHGHIGGISVDAVSCSACVSSTNAVGKAKQAVIAAWALGASDCSLTARNPPECALWRWRFEPSAMGPGGLQ